MEILSYIFFKANTLYIEMINDLPPGTAQSGNLYVHPWMVLGAWSAKKIGLDRLSGKIVRKAIDSAKKGIESINKNLENKL